MRTEGSRNVAIAGAGIAGLVLGTKLAQQGVDVDVFDPHLTKPDFRFARSTPFIGSLAASYLGLDLGEEHALTKVNTESGPPLKTILERRLNFLQHRPMYAVGMNYLLMRLRENAHAHGVNLIDQRVNDIILEGKDQETHVTGIVVGGEEVRANLVVDATGREAHIAHMLTKKTIDGVNQVNIPQESKFVAVYADLPDHAKTEIDSNTLYFGSVQGKLASLVAPRVPDGQHLMLVEGNPQRISAATPDLPRPQKEIAMLQTLFNNTRWAEVANNLTPEMVNQTLLFHYRQAQIRDFAPHIKGVILMGDARKHTNPLFAQGVKSAKTDVQQFMNLFTAEQGDLERAAEQYREYQKDKIGLDHIIKTYGLWRAVGMLSKTSDLLRRIKSIKNRG